MTVKEFMEICDKLTADVVNDCMVMMVDKQSSIYSQEAEFAIRVKLVKDVQPDHIVNEIRT